MKKNFKMSAFSLMEMMIVLLIVALIAAASAPLISKKMMRQTGTGDSPWVFTGTGNNIAFNMNHNPNDTVIIGRQNIDFENNAANYADNFVTRVNGVPLFINAPNANDPNVANGAQRLLPSIAFADDRNRIMGYLGMSRGSTFFSNLIPDSRVNRNAGATIVGADLRVNSPVFNKTIFGYNIQYTHNTNNPNNFDILFGSNISGINANTPDPGRNEANIIIGDHINGNNSNTINSTVVISNNIGGASTLANNGNISNGIAIGAQSTVLAGDSPIALGFNSTSGGNNMIAIGANASAINRNNVLGTSDAIAIGNTATASGSGSVAIGNRAQTQRGNSIIIGNHQNNNAIVGGATQNNTIAIGNCAEASGTNAIAIGSLGDGQNVANITRARGSHSIAIGTNAKALGNNSVAIGNGAVAQNNNEIVLGRASGPGIKEHTVVIPGTLSVNSIDETTLDAISEALKPYSDIRLKNVGEKFTSGLEDIKKLNFFNYTYKNDKEKNPHVGVMAQDLQKVFPISVSEGSDGYLRIRLDEMFYAALNAIKELDNKIIEIKNKVVAYFDRVEKLEAQIDAQQKTIEELRAQNAEFKKRLTKIEKGVNKGAGAKNNVKHIESEAK